MINISATPLIQNNPDTAAIQSILADEESAWNAGDAEGYSKHVAEDGTFTNIVGQFNTGRDQFLACHEKIFKGLFFQTTLQQKLVSLKFIRPDVAVVETLVAVSGFSKGGPPPGTHLNEGVLYTRLLQVLVKEATAWKIVTYHNVDVKPGLLLQPGQ